MIEASRMAGDEPIDVPGRARIEAVLQLSAADVAGGKHQGRRGATWAGMAAKTCVGMNCTN